MTETYNRFKVAYDILDAGNMRAIAREFVKVVDDAMEELKVTTQVWSDPAVVVVATKIAELTGSPTSFANAYEEVLKRRFK